MAIDQVSCQVARHPCWLNFFRDYPLVNQASHGKSPFLICKSTISIAIFNSYVKLPEGKASYQYLGIKID